MNLSNSLMAIWISIVTLSVVSLYLVAPSNKPKKKKPCGSNEEQKKSNNSHSSQSNKEMQLKKERSPQFIQTDDDIFDDMLTKYEQQNYIQPEPQKTLSKSNNTQQNGINSSNQDDKWYYQTNYILRRQIVFPKPFLQHRTCNKKKKVNQTNQSNLSQQATETNDNAVAQNQHNPSEADANPCNDTHDLAEKEYVEEHHPKQNKSDLILIEGYARVSVSDPVVTIPLEIIEMLAAYSNYADLLVIAKNETKTLPAADYIFNAVIIQHAAILTVNGWHSDKREGGKLSIRSLTKFVIEKGGKIQLDGKGYKGGKSQHPQSWTGESYKKLSVKQYVHNFGGGGGGTRGYGLSYGGGGGYGTNGGSQHSFKLSRNGGVQYGDKWINELHLGSGGGGNPYSNGCGGNGGGALRIQCNVFRNDGEISVNGADGGYCSGGGSGGSVVIEFEKLIIGADRHCCITAVGGKGRADMDDVLNNGGFGRIRIKSDKNDKSTNAFLVSICDQQIIPSPFIG